MLFLTEPGIIASVIRECTPRTAGSIAHVFRALLMSLVALCALILAGCGGGGGGGTVAKTFHVTPAVVTVAPGNTASFSAVGAKNGVIWSVDGGDVNGTVTPEGLYHPPATPGTYAVRATSKSDPTKTATATVTVSAGVNVAIVSPSPIPLTVPRSQITFTAQVTGTSNTAVDWSVDGQLGAINGGGVFTAPSTPGTYTVTARSRADASKTASVNVQVVANVNVRIKWQGKSDVVLSLRPDKAPNTVANFVTLVNKGFYDGILAHRYVANFVIQWGDPLTKTLPLDDPSIGTGGPGYKIPFEVNDLQNVQYSLAMARSDDPDSAGSQVYVNLVDNPSLNHTDTEQGYVVFGAVNSGQATIDALRVGDKIVSAKVEAVP